MTQANRLLAFFGVVRERDEPSSLVFSTGQAPFVCLTENGSANRRTDDGAFGLLSLFAKEIAYRRKTYNAKLKR